MIQVLAVIPAILAAVMLRTDRRIIRTLRDAHASSTATAIPIESDSRLMRRRLERLIRRGAVQTTDTNRYYINEIAWRVYQVQRRRRGLTMIVILVPLVILLVWWMASGEPVSSARPGTPLLWAYA